MKWKYKTHKNTKFALTGKERVIRRFAWFPVKLTAQDIKVWLEFYNVKQKEMSSEYYGQIWIDIWYF